VSLARSRAQQSKPSDIVSLYPNLSGLTFPKHALRIGRGQDAHGTAGDPKVHRLVSKPPAMRGREALMLSYTTPMGVESEDLTLAYLRYIELHGHALHDGRGGCAMTIHRTGRASETKTFRFWSRRAAREFEVFWQRYRLVYGHGGRDGLAAA
jgi:hypothetical protein